VGISNGRIIYVEIAFAIKSGLAKRVRLCNAFSESVAPSSRSSNGSIIIDAAILSLEDSYFQ